MRNLPYIAVLILVALRSSSAQGGFEVAAGDLISFGNGPGSPAGIYHVDVLGSGSTQDFQTFCVELTEHVNFTTTYFVQSVGLSTDQGANALGAQAAWLYTQFLNKNASKLAGFQFSAPTTPEEEALAGRQADALQLGVWRGMAVPYEIPDIVSLSGWTDDYVTDELSPLLDGWLANFNSDVSKGRWSSTGNVQIMSLRKFEYDDDGPIMLPSGERIKLTGYAQDQLVQTYPNPELPSFQTACAALGCASLWCLLAMVRRRRLTSAIA